MRRACTVTALAIALAACGSGSAAKPSPLAQLAPTAPMPLSPGNAAGQDEDPSILVARSGDALWAAWYSNRAGLHPNGRERKEIFVARSVDGIGWTDPVQVTSAAEWSFYPSLAQGADGVFHLTWMRWRLLPQDCVPPSCGDYESHILYNRSSDGITWNAANEVEITSGSKDELASIVAASDGRLLMYFDSPGLSVTKDIFVAVHDATGWNSPQAANGVSSDTLHDSFPHVAERAPGAFLMTWTRSTDADPLSISTTSASATMLSTSSDGVTWTAPIVASGASGSSINVLPFLYPDDARQSWSVLWTTLNGTVTLPVDALDPVHLATVEVPLGGYTVRVAPSPTAGIYWSAWAEGAEPTQKVRQRFLAK
jgi:hypothetical protein